MLTSLLFFALSLGIASAFLWFGDDDMCLFCRILAYLSSLSVIYWFIDIFNNFAPLWMLAIPIIIGTIYLMPGYIKSYQEGKVRREKNKNQNPTSSVCS